MAAALMVGAFGTLIGSFLNVVIYRVPLGKSIVAPPSACGACGHEVRGYDNIPLISWLVLRGKCRDCAAPISVRYPLVELAGAIAFGLVAWRFVPAVVAASGGAEVAAAVVQLVAYLYLVAISIALALIDLDTRRLPNVIVLPAYLVGLALLGIAALLTGSWSALATAGIGAVVTGGLYLILALVRPGAMGMGDVKLAGVVGLFLGWLGVPELILGTVAAFILGGVVGVGMLLAGRGRKAAIAFGPWILAGAWIAILAGAPLVRAYLSLFGIT
jgi:leader peptidase (prepilin peptidase)/N-methyltransferase